MKSLNLFAVKNRFSAICAEVEQTGEPLVITRHGKPWVQISPLEKSHRSSDVWASVEENQTKYGKIQDELELPERHPAKNRPSPLTE